MTALPSTAPTRIDRLYRLLASRWILIILLLLTGAVVLAGAILPQAPAQSTQTTTAHWLAETIARYGSLGEPLRAVGLFDLAHTPWVRGLLALLAFILLLRLGLNAGEAWQRLRAPEPAQTAALAARWPHHASATLPGAVTEVTAELADDLRSEGWRVNSHSTPEATYLLAERSAWGIVTPLLFHLGLLGLLAGLWLGQTTGWRVADVVLAPDQPVRVSQAGQLTLTLRSTVGDAALDTVAFQRNGKDIAAKSFSWLGTARAAGVTVRRTGTGQALRVAAREASGAALPLQAVDQTTSAAGALTLVFDQPRAEQVFLAPTRQLVFSAVAFPSLPERGFAGPAFLVQAFADGQREPVANQFFDADTDLTIKDDVYLLTVERYAVATVSHNPGWLLALPGGALALLAGVLAVTRPAGRLALTVQQRRQASEITAHVQASPFWREAAAWLAAWSTTYNREG